MATDITGHKQAEEALYASEIRYRRLFEASKEGILIIDAETGMVLNVNPFLIELLGYSQEQFLGKRLWELGFLKDIVANQSNFEELLQEEYIRYEDMPMKNIQWPADRGGIHKQCLPGKPPESDPVQYP